MRKIVSLALHKISVVVPVYNERGNIEAFHKEVLRSLLLTKKPFEIIYIDDHSSDGTFEWLQKAKRDTGVKVFLKNGKPGKAFSLVEGFAKASGDIFAMVDADLQYPPSQIPAMIKKLAHGDIVVGNRKKSSESALRKLTRSAFRFLFGRMLLGLNADVQSGLKVFKRSVYETVRFTPSSEWTFDAEFLVRSAQAGFVIANHDIIASPRTHGVSKIHIFKNSIEIGCNAISLSWKHFVPQSIPPVADASMIGAGVGNKKKQYITHTTLPISLSALQTFSLSQKLFALALLLSIIAGLLKAPLLTAQVLVGLLSVLYFVDTIFNVLLVMRSLHKPGEIQATDDEIQQLSARALPVYSILCPLYKEASVLPQFLDAIGKLDYPAEKLDVLLLLEANDKETIAAAHKMHLPSYVRIVVVPDSQPKTKPKACNYGLSLAKGEYLVIYDAEDVPDPLQLKKAFIGFQKSPASTACLQAKLNYYNARQNLLTRFFTAEYSLWFDLTLTGLQSMNASVPLGGTSNHFKIDVLRALRGWDPFNVTEDADLGVRLYQKGYQTAIIDSTTFEEATSRPRNWLRQRSRWVKGYMQTYLVHMRNTGQFVKTKGVLQNLIFQLTVGGKLLFILLNPLMWLITISYFVAFRFTGLAIEAVFAPPVSYLAVFSLVFGNFLFLYCYMIACAKRKHWDLMKYITIIPAYWVMMSIAAYIAFYQLIAKPHYWEKTFHGFHLQRKAEETAKPQPKLAYAPVYARVQAQERTQSVVKPTPALVFRLRSLFAPAFQPLQKISLDNLGILRAVTPAIANTSTSYHGSKGGIATRSAQKRNVPQILLDLLPSVVLFSILFVDLLLAQHYLSGRELKLYLLLSFVGKSLFILAFSIAFASIKSLKKNKLAIRQLPILLPLMYIINVASFNLFSAKVGFADPLISYSALSAIMPYSAFYLFALLCALVGNIVVFHYAKKGSLTFGFASLLFILLEVYFLHGHHEDSETFVKTLAYLASLNLITTFVLTRNFILVRTIENNITSFFGLFTSVPLGKAWEEKRLRILIFNWRDTKHVYSGGAEVYVHELAKQWVKDGNSVMMFAGNDHNNKTHEVVDGIEIFRRGGTFTVYLFAVIYYFLKLRRRVDVVIDCENGIPFFTPLFVRRPKILLIFHVHQEIFREFLRFPLNMIAVFLEGRVMPALYKSGTVATISQSSRQEIIKKLGFSKEEDIAIIHSGVSERMYKQSRKTSYPSYLYLGRLKRYKNVDIAIKAFAQIAKELPHAKLTIAGNGEMMPELKALASTLGISSQVEFLGKVTEEQKTKLYGQSWVVVQPSQMEGWGITVIEANAAGTPVIASRVNGLVDSIVDGKTGLLVEPGNAKQLALAMRMLVRNNSYRLQLSEEALNWSKNFTWKTSAETFYQVIGECIGQEKSEPIFQTELPLSAVDAGGVEATS